MSLHLADTYYLPSSQGGDVQRPRCFRGRTGVPALPLTLHAWEANCPVCLALHHGQAVPKPTRSKPRLIVVEPLSVVGPKATMRGIAAEVCQRRGLVLKDIVHQDKRKATTAARQEAMWLMRAAGYRWTQIGGFLNRNHATVIFGVRQHGDRLAALQVAA